MLPDFPPHRRPRRRRVQVLLLRQMNQVKSFQNGDPLERNPEEVRNHENRQNARWLNL